MCKIDIPWILTERVSSQTVLAGYIAYVTAMVNFDLWWFRLFVTGLKLTKRESKSYGSFPEFSSDFFDVPQSFVIPKKEMSLDHRFIPYCLM